MVFETHPAIKPAQKIGDPEHKISHFRVLESASSFHQVAVGGAMVFGSGADITFFVKGRPEVCTAIA